MRTDTFCRYLGLLFSAGLLAGGVVQPAAAATVTATYTFEAPQFTDLESTPLLNRAPNSGTFSVTASFTSKPDAAGLTIAGFQPNNLFTGEALVVPSSPEQLTITLSQPVTGISVDFATIVHATFNLLSPVGNTSLTSAVVGGTFEGGTLTYTNSTPFISFQLSALDSTNASTLFAIDNLTLTAVPEPGAGVWMLLGTGAFALARRFRR